jgi:hypothetical protein
LQFYIFPINDRLQTDSRALSVTLLNEKPLVSIH